jgi:hypothetical protein
MQGSNLHPTYYFLPLSPTTSFYLVYKPDITYLPTPQISKEWPRIRFAGVYSIGPFSDYIGDKSDLMTIGVYFFYIISNRTGPIIRSDSPRMFELPNFLVQYRSPFALWLRSTCSLIHGIYQVIMYEKYI